MPALETTTGRALLALALLAPACAEGDGGTWVDELPLIETPTEPFPARETWVDLLALPPTPLDGSPAPAVVDVEVERFAERLSGAEEVRRGRAGELEVISDRRRAYRVPLEESVAFDLEIPAGGRFRTAFAVLSPSGKRLPPGVSVSLAVELEPEDNRLSVARAKIYGGLQSQWHDAVSNLSGPGRLRFSARVDGDPGEAAPLAVAFATPSIELSDSRVPDVVLVSVDTLRADRLGCYGYDRDVSPNIDRLAERGVVFEECTSQAPWTLPSYGSLFTSLYPAEHRAGISEKAEVWTRGGDAADYEKKGQKLLADVPTLAGELRRAGYRTASLYFNPYLSPQTGIARGFDEHAFLRFSANAGVDRALEWLDRNEGLPRFLFLQLIDPHWPYAPPAPWDERFAGRSVDSIAGYPWALANVRESEPTAKRKQLLSDLYDGEVAYTDAELGRLFDALERRDALDEAIVVFHSDHGEEFWEHGRFEHGHSMHRELLRVPFILSAPARLQPGRVSEHVRAIDAFPTLLDLLGLPEPEGLRGSSLLPLARGEAEDVHLVGWAESILWGRPYAPFDEAKTLIDDDWKLVVGDGDAAPQLYSVSGDPAEARNLAAAEPEVVEEMRAELVRRYESARTAGVGELLELREGEEELLGNLGYAAGDEESEDAPLDGPE